MTLQQFCLRWNNHQPNFISVFATLLNSESLVDVTLAAEGRHLQAHRVVLSACSSYFQSLFTVNPCQHPIVILKDVKFDDLKTMVDFMYYGEVNVSQEQLPAILKTAEMLKIKGLAEMPERHNSTSALHASKSSSISFDKADFMTSIDSTGGLDIRHTPSPSSPSTRRKRLRKSSTGSGSGSTERNSEETVNEITIIPTNSLVKAEPITPAKADVRSFARSRTGTQEASTDSETRDGSQESVDDDRMHVERSPADSPGEAAAAASLSDPAWPSTSRQSDTSPVSKIGKRGRLLMRQPRVKKETEPQQTSPDSEPGSPRLAAAQIRIDTEPGSPRPKPVRLDSDLGLQRLAPMPLRLESEAACPRLAPKPARNESEPGSPRSAPVRFDSGDGGGASRLAPYPVRIDSPESSRLVSVPLRIEEGGTTRMQVPPVRLERQGSECRVSPPRSTALHLLSVPQPSYLVKQHSHPLLPSQKQRGAGGSAVHRQLSTPTPASQPLQVHFCPSLPYKDGDAGDVPMSRSVSDHAEPVRAPRPASGELRRASSSPQASTPREGFEMRSVHCPMLRPGPALGCNFCWNTVDAHGRILRRKTKYHCPECQTNLCIVPCFQEYHERNAAGGGGATSPNGGRPALPKNSSI